MNRKKGRDFALAQCTKSQMERLDDFVAMLLEENKRQNLISPRTEDDVWERHIVDSLQIRNHLKGEQRVGLDLGSGAGLPGIVLAVAAPDVHWNLVESRRLRINWLRHVSSSLNLANVTVIGNTLARVRPFSAGIITARAFAPLDTLLDLSGAFSTDDTVWVLPKGASAAQELNELPERLRAMFHVEQSITDPVARIIVGKGKVERQS